MNGTFTDEEWQEIEDLVDQLYVDLGIATWEECKIRREK